MKLKSLLSLILVTAVVGFSSLGLLKYALAAWDYAQNFDALTDGDLVGQDSWTGSADRDVGTTQAQSGTKSVEIVGTPSVGIIERDFTAITDTGRFSFYVRASANNVGDIFDFEDGNANSAFLIGLGWNTNGQITHLPGGSTTNIQAYANDTWIKIEFEFDVSTDTYVYSIDDAADSSSQGFIATRTQLSHVQIRNHNAANFFFDTIADEDGGGAAAVAEDILYTPTWYFNEF